MGSSKKHKKHKSERKSKYDERAPSLKLILKVGGTPEYNANSPASYGIQSQPENEFFSSEKKKHKKKKKKKDREKRHKHHKEKKHRRESGEEDNSMDEDTAQLIDNPQYYSSVSTSSNISSTPVTRPMIPVQINVDQEQSTPLSESMMSPQQSCMSPDSKLGIKQEDVKMSLESPRTPSSLDSGAREPRTCVLKLKQSRGPLAKLLDHLLKALEKRDPHQFFAWPVTDLIAPGYSQIITKPMDFSTIRQKIEDNEYATLNEFSDDFKLMCENAIRYNHAETVYHKAAKRLLHVGSKLLQPDSLIRTLRPLAIYMKELSPKELGFDFASTSQENQDNESHHADSADEAAISSAVDENIQAQLEEEEKRKQRKIENDPKTKFEPFVDNLTSDEILEQVKSAAKAAKESLLGKKKARNMGFLRTHNDGSTSLQIVVNGQENMPERMPTLGNFIGKLQQGTSQLQGFPRDDRRNITRLPKTLDYGAFSSYAPIFDSRFSNLSKDETDLILNTYGDETGSQYADSIMKFSKDSLYASTLATRLLDLLTCGEHSKTMEVLTESERQKTVQKEVEKALPDWSQEAKRLQNVQVDFEKLRSLKDIGMDVAFVDEIERFMKGIKTEDNLQEQLTANASLMEQLHHVQYERLSAPLPHHLLQVPQPDKNELQIASQITSNFTEIAKKLPPTAVASIHGIRKAMGISVPGFDALKKTDNAPTEMDLDPPKTQPDHVDLDSINFDTASIEQMLLN